MIVYTFEYEYADGWMTSSQRYDSLLDAVTGMAQWASINAENDAFPAVRLLRGEIIDIPAKASDGAAMMHRTYRWHK